jgi:hypothetical protein
LLRRVSPVLLLLLLRRVAPVRLMLLLLRLVPAVLLLLRLLVPAVPASASPRVRVPPAPASASDSATELRRQPRTLPPRGEVGDLVVDDLSCGRDRVRRAGDFANVPVAEHLDPGALVR